MNTDTLSLPLVSFSLPYLGAFFFIISRQQTKLLGTSPVPPTSHSHSYSIRHVGIEPLVLIISLYGKKITYITCLVLAIELRLMYFLFLKLHFFLLQSVFFCRIFFHFLKLKYMISTHAIYKGILYKTGPNSPDFGELFLIKISGFLLQVPAGSQFYKKKVLKFFYFRIWSIAKFG